MAITMTGDQLAIYQKDMFVAEKEGYDFAKIVLNDIFKVETDDGDGDKETQMLGPGSLKRHTVEGEAIDFNSPVQGWPFYVKYSTFSDGLAFTYEASEDIIKKVGNDLKGLARQWGEQVNVSEETEASRVFNNGGALSGDRIFNGTNKTAGADPSGDLCADSKPLFNLSGNLRTTKGGGTYYNSFAGYTLTAPNFEAVYVHMTSVNNRSERDIIYRNRPDTLLTDNGADIFLADRILGTTRGIPGQELNDLNPYLKLGVSHIAWDYLTDSAFYVGKRKTKKLVFRRRKRPDITFYRHHDTGGYRAYILTRSAPFVKDAWKVWVRGGGSAS